MEAEEAVKRLSVPGPSDQVRRGCVCPCDDFGANTSWRFRRDLVRRRPSCTKLQRGRLALLVGLIGLPGCGRWAGQVARLEQALRQERESRMDEVVPRAHTRAAPPPLAPRPLPSTSGASLLARTRKAA